MEVALGAPLSQMAITVRGTNRVQAVSWSVTTWRLLTVTWRVDRWRPGKRQSLGGSAGAVNHKKVQWKAWINMNLMIIRWCRSTPLPCAILLDDSLKDAEPKTQARTNHSPEARKYGSHSLKKKHQQTTTTRDIGLSMSDTSLRGVSDQQ